MTACPRCGSAVSVEEQFCGSCGEYLDWDQQETAAPAAPPAPAATVPAESSAPEPAAYTGPTAPQPTAYTGPTAATGGGAPASTAPGGTGQAAAGAAAAAANIARNTAGTVYPSGTSVPGVPTTIGGAAAAVPGVPAAAVPTPAPDAPYEPPPVQPGTVPDPSHRARTRPAPGNGTAERPVVPGVELLGPDQVRCGPCGAANDDTRKFCRRCGAPLAVEAAPVEAKRSWWRRLLGLGPKGVKREKWHAAGHRRSVRRIRIMRIVGIFAIVSIVLGAVAMWPARPVVDGVVNSIKDRFTDHVPVVPTDIRTSSIAPGSKAQNLLDGIADQYWAPEGDGIDGWVEVDFPDPIRLTNIVVSSGASRTQEVYLTQARAQKLELTMTDSNGKTTTEELTLEDKADPQTFDLGVSDVVSAKLTIKSSYGYERGKVVAIAELEFFARK